MRYDSNAVSTERHGENRMTPEIADYYATTQVEAQRLERSTGLLEKLRTLEILARYLPPVPATVLDVGGASFVAALGQLPAHARQQYGTVILPDLSILLLQFLETIARGAQIIVAAASIQ